MYIYSVIYVELDLDHINKNERLLNIHDEYEHDEFSFFDGSKDILHIHLCKFEFVRTCGVYTH